jgi:hypothetical protein
MALIPNAIDRAARELEKLQAARVKLEEELVTDEARSRQFREQFAELELAALLGEGPAPVRTDIVELELQVAGKKKAFPLLMLRMRGAVKALASARAESLRQKAGKRQTELSKYAAERQRLLDALESWTACRWLVDTRPEGEVLIGAAGQEIAPGKAAPLDKGVLAAREIDDLKRQADAIEAAALEEIRGGIVAGSTLEELLQQTAEHPLAPSAKAIEAWHTENDWRAAGEWAREYPEGRFMASTGPGAGTLTPATRLTTYALAWTSDATIDPARSGATSRLAPLP